MTQQKIAFRFNSGRLSLDLVCTLRHRPSKHTELFNDPSDLSRWLNETHLITQHVSVDDKQFEAAKKLRQAIFEIATSLQQGQPGNRKNVKVLNDFAAQPVATVQLDERSWRQISLAEDPVAAGLSVVARDAIELFTGPQATLIRACDEPGCQMLYVDLSPGRRRRWCSMTRCGSRAKVDAFRKRHDAQDTV